MIPFKDAGKIVLHKVVYNLVDKAKMKPFWDDRINIWARLTWVSDVATGFNDLC